MIKHLKPRSEEEIITLFKNLSPNEKLKEGCAHKYIRLVESALREGADEHQKTGDSLIWAIVYENVEIVKLLVNANANTNVLSPFGLIYMNQLLKNDKAS